MADPPELAELILRGLLRADMRESVSGDLLEEYRESRVPDAGRPGADLWYWRQVGGMWVRAYGWLLAPVVVLLVVHDVFNVFRAPSGASYLDGLPRVAGVMISPFGIAGLLGLATAYGSSRTQRWQGGFVAALGVSALAWLFAAVWSAATFYAFARVQYSNPYWVAAWHWSTQRGAAAALAAPGPGAPEETFVHWLYWDNVGALMIGGIALLLTSLVCGGIAAILGELFAHRRPAARRNV